MLRRAAVHTTTPDTNSEESYVRALRGVFRDAAEQGAYLRDSWARIEVVLDLLESLDAQDRIHRVLELGANPYVMTSLLQRRFDFQIELANYFEGSETGERGVHVAERSGNRVEFPFSHFNIERDRFPYPDGTFDCVLFCEILEHLLVDADHAVGEIERVLRPGGIVVLTTPNATRLSNLYFLALGRNIYDGYSPNGPYGRHNREYTLAEVDELLTRHGFDCVEERVCNIQPLARRFTYLQWLRPRTWYEHLFVVARKPAGAK